MGFFAPTDWQTMSSVAEPSTREYEDPILDQLAMLLLSQELLAKWAETDPERVGLFNRTYRCVGRLESATGWEIETLLERLGCDTKTKKDFEDLTPNRLARCLDYMYWVEGLLADFDRQLDKCLVLAGASRFYKLAGKDLRAVKRIMSAGDFSPLCYLEIGENAQAWETATRGLDGPVGERARELWRANPLADEDAPHISAGRMEILAAPDASELLGKSVVERMRAHIDGDGRGNGCTRCQAARAGIGSVPVLR